MAYTHVFLIEFRRRGYCWAPVTGTLREDQHTFTTVLVTVVTMVVFSKVSSVSIVGTLLAVLSGVDKYSAPRASNRNEHTSCSRVLLEKLIGSELVKKFPAFYRT